jgi:hypothetical protein
MSRLRKMARIPAASWTQWVVAGVWVRMLVILFPLSAKAKVTAAGTPRCSCSRASRSRPCGQPVFGRQVGCAGIGTSGRAGSTPGGQAMRPPGPPRPEREVST